MVSISEVITYIHQQITGSSINWKYLLTAIIVLEALPKAAMQHEQARAILRKPTDTLKARYTVGPSRIEMACMYAQQKVRIDTIAIAAHLAMRLAFLYCVSSIWNLLQFLLPLTPLSQEMIWVISSLAIMSLYMLAWSMIEIGVAIHGNRCIKRVGLRRGTPPTLKNYYCVLINAVIVPIIYASPVFAYWINTKGQNLLVLGIVAALHCAGTNFWGIMGLLSYISWHDTTPLEDGELKDSLQNPASMLRFRSNKIYVVDGTFTPFLRSFFGFKSLILSKRTIERCTTEQVLALVAHGIAKESWKPWFATVISTLLNYFMLVFAYWITVCNPCLSTSLGFENHQWGVGLTVCAMISLPAKPLVRWGVSLILHNRFEDEVRSCVEMGYGRCLMSAIWKQFQIEWSQPSDRFKKCSYHGPYISCVVLGFILYPPHLKKTRNLVYAGPMYTRYYLNDLDLTSRYTIIKKMVEESESELKV